MVVISFAFYLYEPDIPDYGDLNISNGMIRSVLCMDGLVRNFYLSGDVTDYIV